MTADRPDDVLFADLMATWARHVIDAFLWLVDLDSRAEPGFVVMEVWVGADFHLYVRYRAGSRLLGARLGRLDMDPTSALPLSPTASGTASASSTRLASDLYHGGFATGPDPGPPSWRDPFGHAWWGEPPGAGWESALDGERVVSRPV